MSAIVRYSAHASNKLHSVCPNNLVLLKRDTSLFSLACACPPISEEKILSNFNFDKNLSLDKVFQPRSLLVIFAVGDIHLIFDDGENGIGVRSHSQYSLVRQGNDQVHPQLHSAINIERERAPDM